jgi:hypothetical protein
MLEKEIDLPQEAGIPVQPWELRSKLYAWGYGEPLTVVITTRLLLWGYGKPLAVALRNEFVESQEAQEFAAARGWDAAGRGAWAKEIGLPLTLPEAAETVESALRSCEAVAGWAGREVSPAEIVRLHVPRVRKGSKNGTECDCSEVD